MYIIVEIYLKKSKTDGRNVENK